MTLTTSSSGRAEAVPQSLTEAPVPRWADYTGELFNFKLCIRRCRQATTIQQIHTETNRSSRNLGFLKRQRKTIRITYQDYPRRN